MTTTALSGRRRLWCVAVYFNPVGFDRTAQNYLVFAEGLKSSGANLLTVELSFDGRYYLPDGPGVIRLQGRSIMWQKERLISFAVSQLPAECEYVAWLDGDLLFLRPDWQELAIEKLQTVDFVQLFCSLHRLGRPREGSGEVLSPLKVLHSTVERVKPGLVSQRITLGDEWDRLRAANQLEPALPGYCWAARRRFFQEVGMYDRAIVGAGDKVLAYSLLDIFDPEDPPFPMSRAMLKDVLAWRERLRGRHYRIDYLPVDVVHLWHGTCEDRQYQARHFILRDADFDPTEDVRIQDGVLEWASPKPALHDAILRFFQRRQEDG